LSVDGCANTNARDIWVRRDGAGVDGHGGRNEGGRKTKNAAACISFNDKTDINATSYQTLRCRTSPWRTPPHDPCHVIEYVGIQLLVVPCWPIRPQFGSQSRTPGPQFSPWSEVWERTRNLVARWHCAKLAAWMIEMLWSADLTQPHPNQLFHPPLRATPSHSCKSFPTNSARIAFASQSHSG
jgi:hypothetical protein